MVTSRSQTCNMSVTPVQNSSHEQWEGTALAVSLLIDKNGTLAPEVLSGEEQGRGGCLARFLYAVCQTVSRTVPSTHLTMATGRSPGLGRWGLPPQIRSTSALMS